MPNIVKKIFKGSSTITIPAGVQSVTLLAIKNARGLEFGRGGGLIDPTGNLYMMGEANKGPLGVGDLTPRSSPTLVAGTLKFMQAVYNGGGANGINQAAMMMGLTTANVAYSWGGCITNGALGQGNASTPTSSPVAILGGLSFAVLKFMNAQGNSNVPAGITTAGAMYAWGNNASGQQGNGTVAKASSPVLVLGGLTWQDYAGLDSDLGCVGLTVGGVAYGWGGNTSGSCGDNSVTPRSSPVLVAGSLLFSSIIASQNTAYGLIQGTGAAYSWGKATSGQLGDGTTVDKSSPVLVLGGLTFAQLICTPANTLAVPTVFGLTQAGKLYGWGNNASGNIGDGTTVGKSSPVAVAGSLVFQKVQVANGTVMGLTTDGILYSWGGNADGQIGDNSTTSRSSPALVSGGLKWVDFSISQVQHQSSVPFTMVLGITQNGLLYGWGYNNDGQIGDASVVPKSSPVLVVGNLFAQSAPQTVNNLTVQVSPGVTYPINIGPNFTSFGGTMVANGVIDSLVVSYQQ